MNKGKTIGYIRVSTNEQNPERQLQGIQLDKTFIEYATGSTTDRYQLKLLMEYIRDDDIVIVHSMDRLARNVRHLLGLIEEFTKKGVKVQFIKENLTFSGDDCPTSKLLLTVMGAVAEFELSMIKERQKEGIAIAKAAGKYKGNHKKAITPENREVILEGLKTRKSLTIIAEEAKICRTSLYEFIKILKAEGYEHPISYRRNNFVDKEWAEIEKVKKELQKNG